jgi:hypothetical protein
MCNSYLFQLNCQEILPILYAIFVYSIIFSEQTKIPQIQLITIFFILHYYFKTFFDNKLINDNISCKTEEIKSIENEQLENEKEIITTTPEIKSDEITFSPKTDVIFSTLADIINEKNSAASGNPKNEGDLPQTPQTIQTTNEQQKNVENPAPMQSKWYCCGSWSWCGAIG